MRSPQNMRGKKMKPSKRSNEVQESPIRKLMPFANETKKKGIKVYHLNIGQPDIETPEVMLEAYKNFNEKIISYGPSQGLDEYRQSLVKYYSKLNIILNESDIIVTVAGSEACLFAMYTTCDPGDEIIIPEPFYTNYNSFASMACVNIVPFTTYAETGFSLPSRDEIESLITSKTRAIMICNPSNPTGTVYTLEELNMLAEIAIKHNLFLISDEVYREFVYEGEKATSILEIKGLEEHAVVCDSISKRYSACGSRIGCIISRNKKIMDNVLKYGQARLCPPTIDQLAACATEFLPEDFLPSIMSEYNKRRNLVYDSLKKIDGVVCVKPRGAFYIIAKLPIEDAELFTIWLLKDFNIDNETVMLAPAEGFYATAGLGKNEVRIAYILNEQDLEKAMHIFVEGLKQWMKDN